MEIKNSEMPTISLGDEDNKRDGIVTKESCTDKMSDTLSTGGQPT